MAELILTPTALHYCNSASVYEDSYNVWSTYSMSTNYTLYYGTNYNAIQQYRQRYTFNQSLNSLGKVTGFSFSNIARTTSATATDGTLYVSTSNLRPRQATETGAFANWAVSGTGTGIKMTITNFNLSVFLNAIGSSSTWYVSLYSSADNDYYRHWTNQSANVRGTITYEPNTIYVNSSGTWKQGEMWTNVSGSWKKGEMWTNVSGSWKKGTI